MTLHIEAPGPGTWNLDRVHGPNGYSPFLEELGEPALARGFRETFKRYGAVISHLQFHMINGFQYGQMLPAPPEEIPERFANAEHAWETRLWRADVEWFHNEVKPDSRARNRALAAVDVSALTDAQLADHLDACAENVSLMVERHHIFNGAAMAPVGDFLATALPWGVASPSQLLGLLQGSSRASAGGCEELAELADALRADPDARALLDGEPAEAVEALRTRPAPVGPAMQAVIDFVGLRPVDGFDVVNPLVIERPELLVRTIVEALEGPPGADASADVAAATEAIRSRVPEEHRDTFDARLAEARLAYHLRDERGLYQDVWAWGIARKAVLEIARRLAAAGRISNPEDLFHASYTEMRAILRAEPGAPTADDLVGRRKAREAVRPEDMPDFLGDPPGPPPPLDGLPPAVARTMTALGIFMGNLFGKSEAPNEERLARGIGVNEGIYEGTARVLADATELDRIVEGDVLVTQSTTEAFNLALPILGAIVTDHGGLLSHAAIVAREFGLPAVVGCGGATQLIPDGARVRVDAAAGEVHVL